MTMTDLHMHLIPGADDGAQDLAMALEMLSQAERQGITEIFATPHNDAFHFPERKIPEHYKALTSAAKAAFPSIKLYLGCEVYCEVPAMEAILEALDTGLYPTMNGTRFVLAEFPQWVQPEHTAPCLEALVQGGYKPIVAHAERYPLLQGNTELIRQFRTLGAKLQVNAYSLWDEKDPGIRTWAQQLVLSEQADFLGTDAHRTNHRPPMVKNGLIWVQENCRKEYALAITRENAQAYLLG